MRKNEKEEALWDGVYPVYGDARKFYLNGTKGDAEKGEVDIPPILTDSDYDKMMVKNRITVLNKSECGNGGTSGLVDYLKRHSTGGLILVPNVSISKSKEEKYKKDPDICCVYGGVDKIDYDAKIVIATYDQFKRLLTNLRNYGVGGELFSNDTWRGRAIFVDEYHKLVDERFRDIMSKLTELIIKTDLPVTLMSATPHEQYIKELRQVVCDKKELICINVVYDTESMKKCIQVFDMRTCEMKRFIKQVICNDKISCVFYNNVSKIAEILDKVGTDDCEILCSSDDDNKDVCGKYYSECYDESKRVHFMTSAYFTGHDIDGAVDRVYIIGGNSRVENAISMRDIQQILGRFRQHCGTGMNGIFIMHLKEKKSESSHKAVMTKLGLANEYLEGLGDNWTANAACINQKLIHIYCNEALERLEYWSKEDKLIRTLKAQHWTVDDRKKIDRYTVFANTEVVKGKKVYKAYPIGELPDYIVEPSLTYKAAFVKVANGEDVDHDEYPKVYKIKQYIDKYGVTRNRNGNVVIPTREKVFSLTEINNKVESRKNKIALDEMYADVRYAAFGFEDGDCYKAKYLMRCLEYLQMECPDLLSGELDYGMLPLYMKQVFGTNMFCWKADKHNRLPNDEWCITGGRTNKVVNLAERDKFGTVIYIERESEKCPKSPKNTVNVSYYTRTDNKKCMGRTIDWSHMGMISPHLKGIKVYDWVNEDKPMRLFKLKMDMSKLSETMESWEKKGDKLKGMHKRVFKKLSNKTDKELKEWKKTVEEYQKSWSSLKNFTQLKISELYLDSDKEYRHNKATMNMVDCLILDIDNSISFSEFKALYKDWAWVAYPTISNTGEEGDWNKFRVIVPLESPILLEGENNLQVLKALRSEFCVYEDRRHGLPSYVNFCDWMKKVINEGEIYSIEQSEVENMQRLLSANRILTAKKFDEMEIATMTATGDVKDMFIKRTIKKFDDCKEGERDNTVYGQLRFLKDRLDFTSDDIAKVRAGVSRQDMRLIIDDVISRHREWGW